MSSRARPRGFTLVELMVAVFILAMMVGFVYQILWQHVRTRDMIVEDLEGPKIEDAIIDMVSRDLRFLYYRAGLLPADAGFWGRTKQMNARRADRVDFITARTSRAAVLEDTTGAQQPGDSPLTEVGYACRPNDQNNRWLELWRREDYFVDDDPTDGGKFSLVYDKLRYFTLRYFPTPDENTKNEGLDEWDSKVTHKAPYAIILEMGFDLHEPAADEPQQKVVKILLIKPGRSLDLDSGMTDAKTPGMK